MLKELAVERYEFLCRRCAASWAADFEVQHVEDLDGDCWDYYSFNGNPTTAPDAPNSIACPHCHAFAVTAHLAARRDIPLAEQLPAPPRQHVSHPGASLADRRPAPPRRPPLLHPARRRQRRGAMRAAERGRPAGQVAMSARSNSGRRRASPSRRIGPPPSAGRVRR